MENSEKNEFKNLLSRCFGDMALPILENPAENIEKCSLESLSAFISCLSASLGQAVIENSDDRELDAMTELRLVYDKVTLNLQYFKESEMSHFARKYLEDNQVNLSTESGVREFSLFEECMKRHKKDFLNDTFAVSDFLIPDIFHVFLDDTMSMFKEERSLEVFNEVMPRVA